MALNSPGPGKTIGRISAPKFSYSNSPTPLTKFINPISRFLSRRRSKSPLGPTVGITPPPQKQSGSWEEHDEANKAANSKNDEKTIKLTEDKSNLEKIEDGKSELGTTKFNIKAKLAKNIINSKI